MNLLKLLRIGLVLTSLPLLVSSGNLPSTAFSQDCQDFLAEWGKRPAPLRFTGCKKIKNPYSEQSDLLVASYAVVGSQAERVEQALKTDFDMAALHFLCCYWTAHVPREDWDKPILRSREGSYQDPSYEHGFQIMMFSGETLNNQRKQWPDIPEFYVRVETHLGDI